MFVFIVANSSWNLMRVYAYPNSSSFVDFFIDFISHRYSVIWRSGSFACTSTELYSVALDKYVSANQKKKKKKKKTFLSMWKWISSKLKKYTLIFFFFWSFLNLFTSCQLQTEFSQLSHILRFNQSHFDLS